MEFIGRVIKQGSLQSRNWTNNNGEQKIIKSVELVVRSGADEFLAEVNDEQAELVAKTPLNSGVLYKFSVNMRVRTWKSQQTGADQSATSIRVNKIALL